jgi:hypothetical protein
MRHRPFLAIAGSLLLVFLSACGGVQSTDSGNSDGSSSPTTRELSNPSSVVIQAEAGTVAGAAITTTSSPRKASLTAPSGGVFNVVEELNQVPLLITSFNNASGAAKQYELVTYYSNAGTGDLAMNFSVLHPTINLTNYAVSSSGTQTLSNVPLAKDADTIELFNPSATGRGPDVIRIEVVDGTTTRTYLANTGIRGGLVALDAGGVAINIKNGAANFLRVPITGLSTTGLFTVRIIYRNTTTGTLSLSHKITNIYKPNTFATTGSWIRFAPFRLNLFLPVGSSQISTTNGLTFGFGPDLDRFVLDGTLTPTSRDKYVWPFTEASGWNLPLAKTAVYQTAAIASIDEVALEPEFLFDFSTTTGLVNRKVFKSMPPDDNNNLDRCTTDTGFLLKNYSNPPAPQATFDGFPYDGFGRSGGFFPQLVGYQVNSLDVVLPTVPWTGNPDYNNQGFWQPTRRELGFSTSFIKQLSNQNDAFAVLYPNNVLAQGAYLSKCSATSTEIFANLAPDLSVKAGVETYNNNVAPNPGVVSRDVSLYGAHGGTGLSAFGGAIRSGEMNSPSDFAIRHVMKVVIGDSWWMNEVTNLTDCYTWPAISCDNTAAHLDDCSTVVNPCDTAPFPAPGFGRRTASDQPAYMKDGVLLAISPLETPESLGLQTSAGRKIFYAFQDYGAYTVDDAACNCFNLAMQTSVAPTTGKTVYTVANEIAALDATWLEISPNPHHPTQDAARFIGTFKADVVKIAKALHVVTNNAEFAPGGIARPANYTAPDKARRRGFAPFWSN